MLTNNISVIGSEGFIGRAFANSLSKLEISFESFNRARPIFDNNRLNKKILESHTIFWLATKVNPVTAESKNWLCDFEINEWRNFLDLLPNHIKIVFVSSGGCIYMDNDEASSEDSSIAPNNKYGSMKFKMENVIQNLTDTQRYIIILLIIIVIYYLY